jgi:hypothetical protein
MFVQRRDVFIMKELNLQKSEAYLPWLVIALSFFFNHGINPLGRSPSGILSLLQ